MALRGWVSGWGWNVGRVGSGGVWIFWWGESAPQLLLRLRGHAPVQNGLGCCLEHLACHHAADIDVIHEALHIDGSLGVGGQHLQHGIGGRGVAEWQDSLDGAGVRKHEPRGGSGSSASAALKHSSIRTRTGCSPATGTTDGSSPAAAAAALAFFSFSQARRRR